MLCVFHGNISRSLTQATNASRRAGSRKQGKRPNQPNDPPRTTDRGHTCPTEAGRNTASKKREPEGKHVSYNHAISKYVVSK